MTDFLPLAGLALVDSLSAGTLVIPIALIFMWRRVRVGLLGTYLATIATAYFGLGVALLLGFDAAVSRLSGVSEADWFRWVTLVLGAGAFHLRRVLAKPQEAHGHAVCRRRGVGGSGFSPRQGCVAECDRHGGAGAWRCSRRGSDDVALLGCDGDYPVNVLWI